MQSPNYPGDKTNQPVVPKPVIKGEPVKSPVATDVNKPAEVKPVETTPKAQ